MKWLILCLTVFVGALHGLEEKPIVVIIPSYKNSDWVENNLSSIFMQHYTNYRVIYINDASPDNTGQVVEKWLQDHVVDYKKVDFDDRLVSDIQIATKCFSHYVNKRRSSFTLVNNIARKGALANIYRGAQSCDPQEIVVLIDGDDWLYHDQVFSELNQIYSTQNVWLTHGSLIEHPSGKIQWSKPIPAPAIKLNIFRKFRCPSHLKTFYAWLFKKIQLKDLLWNGDFFPMTSDMAIMFPMCEMAAERHAFISSINYVYNMESSLNDNKVNPQLQRDLDALIRSKRPYKRLKK